MKNNRVVLIIVNLLFIGSLFMLGLFAGYYVDFKCLAPHDDVKVTVCLSGSMEPTINVGGWVYTDWSVPFEEIEVGDIILFETPDECELGKYVQHRVYAINEKVNADGVSYRELRTSGDAQGSDDIGTTNTGEYLPYQAKYLGKVVKVDNSKKGLVSLFYGDNKEDEARMKSIIIYLVVFILLAMTTGIITTASIYSVIHKNKKGI